MEQRNTPGIRGITNYGDSAFNSPPTVNVGVRQRLRSGRLRPAFARLEGTFGQSLEPVQKAIVSERPADALRGAQPGEQIGFGLAGRAAMPGEQIAIKRIVGIAEEGARAAIAALGDMVRMTGDDDTGEASHAP
jgi:hypothetical protein